MFQSRMLQAAAAAATVLLVAACQPGESSGPSNSDPSFDAGPRFVSALPTVPITSVPQARPYPGTKVAGEVSVCKDASSPLGHYHFTVSATNAQATDMVADTVTLSPGQCAVVYNRVHRVRSGGLSTQVTITEVIPPNATFFLHHVIRDDDAQGSLNQPGPSVTLRANSNHGGFATFYNEAGTAGSTTTTTGDHHGGTGH